jgi:hypothetical protein
MYYDILLVNCPWNKYSGTVVVLGINVIGGMVNESNDMR